MSFTIFTVIMLALALMARFRAPQISVLPVIWFFLSWLPSELPWLFAVIQTLVTLLRVLTAEAISLELLLSLLTFTGTLVLWHQLHQKTFRAKYALNASLRQGLGKDVEALTGEGLPISADRVSPHAHWLKPFSFRRAGVERLRNIAYGADPQQTLDIVRSQTTNDARPRPVLLHIHGGGWILGKKNQQALPLINYLATQGWICVDINYRLAPKHRLPAAAIDVKLVITWIKQNILEYGGDPEFIAITGESAGGHLCALAALSAQDADLQPGFALADTQVQAAVPLYGIYDFTAPSQTATNRALLNLLTRYVMPKPYAAAPDLWHSLSPKQRAHSRLPPMLVIQGTHDSLALVEDTRRFVNELKAHSDSPVLYVEIEGAQHGFEIFHAVRTEFTIETVGKFLLHTYSNAKHLQKHNSGN